jgi:hypothetical protein
LKNQKLIFSNHAEIRMAARNVSEGEVLSAIEQPDYKEKLAYGKEAFFKQSGKRRLKVVAAHRGNVIKVITVAVTKK